MQDLGETVQNLSHRRKITISSEKIENAFNKKLIDISKKIHIDGFRVGKVPMNIVIQRYGSSVRRDIINNMMQYHFLQSIHKENINLVGNPIYIPDHYEAGSNLTYSVEFEVSPTIELNNLHAIEIENPVVKITEEDVDSMLNIMRQHKAIWKESHAGANIDDKLTIDFKGWIDEKEFKGNQASNFVLVIGQNKLIQDFEKSLIGHKKNDIFDVSIQFPPNYSVDYLKGKLVTFKVFVKKVETCELPEITSKFISSLGVKDGSIATLREKITENIKIEIQNKNYNYIKLQILNALLKNNQKCKVPPVLLKQEIKNLREQANKEFNENKMNISEKMLSNQAKVRIIINLLLCEIIRYYKIKVDEKQLHDQINKEACLYEKPAKLIEFYAKNQDLMDNMRNYLLEKQAINTILNEAHVTEKSMNFKEFMQNVDNYKFDMSLID
ncbi:trigger factor [Candidatus Ishikawella capsulata]|uniref:Trigger factor n=1 Tax=Candidatus Ishikawaella capsulata Mpkobe TaxID=476281 RepID=C5WCZ2_9ENTR|nr:trigger factor [Candidatus Ishikawaella capsulata]BAH83198.1 trigger factor [Candidatus Ishikawaella capsulata Mpkobe]